eukprot:5982285-Amphidinium_carterae.1
MDLPNRLGVSKGCRRSLRSLDVQSVDRLVIGQFGSFLFKSPKHNSLNSLTMLLLCQMFMLHSDCHSQYATMSDSRGHGSECNLTFLRRLPMRPGLGLTGRGEESTECLDHACRASCTSGRLLCACAKRRCYLLGPVVLSSCRLCACKILAHCPPSLLTLAPRNFDAVASSIIVFDASGLGHLRHDLGMSLRSATNTAFRSPLGGAKIRIIDLPTGRVAISITTITEWLDGVGTEVLGAQLLVSIARGVTHAAEGRVCIQPQQALKPRADKGKKWFTCIQCGMRWERLDKAFNNLHDQAKLALEQLKPRAIVGSMAGAVITSFTLEHPTLVADVHKAAEGLGLSYTSLVLNFMLPEAYVDWHQDVANHVNTVIQFQASEVDSEGGNVGPLGARWVRNIEHAMVGDRLGLLVHQQPAEKSAVGIRRSRQCIEGCESSVEESSARAVNIKHMEKIGSVLLACMDNGRTRSRVIDAAEDMHYDLDESDADSPENHAESWTRTEQHCCIRSKMVPDYQSLQALPDCSPESTWSGLRMRFAGPPKVLISDSGGEFYSRFLVVLLLPLPLAWVRSGVAG